MTQVTAFWNLIEDQLRCIVPLYIKNILSISGYDTVESIKTLTDDDLKAIEEFARTEEIKYCLPSNANYKDYFYMFADKPERFTILPGHVKMLKEIAEVAKNIDGIGTMNVLTTKLYINNSSTPNVKEKGNNLINTNQVQVKQERLPIGYSTIHDDVALPTDSKIVIKDELFKALILGGSPDNFYIQLESNFDDLDLLAISMEPANTWPILAETVVGQMCAALFEGSYYRANIVSLKDDGALVHYVDYGNQAFSTDLRIIPKNLQKINHLATCCSLESKNGTFSPQTIAKFTSLSVDDPYEMRFLSKDSCPAIVQLFENGVLFGEVDEPTKSDGDNEDKTNSASSPETQFQISSNGLNDDIASVITTDNCNQSPVIDESDKQFEDIIEANKQFDNIIETMSELVRQNLPDETSMTSDVPQFVEPAPLTDGDLVVIRYVESPKNFYVQQTKYIVEYEAMMDRLCQYCMTAKRLTKFQTGIACAALFNDSEWYRAEIVSINGDKALTRFVDYGIILPIQMDKLKEIGSDFLIFPKQVVCCFLLGFESIGTTTRSSQDTMEFLAENVSGRRRTFKVYVHGRVNEATLLNLTDETEMPILDLSLRLLQLSLSQDKFREYRLRQQSCASAPTTDGIEKSAHEQRNISKVTANVQNCTVQEDAEYLSNNSSSFSSPRRLTSSNFEGNYSNDSGDHHTSRKPYLLDGSVDANIQIHVEAIPMNEAQEVKLSWFFSPLEFYVTTIKSDAELNYTVQMKKIHHFYKDKSPTTKKISIGSFAIAKYARNGQLYRVRIIDFSDAFYKVQLIDVGTLDIVRDSEVYEMDPRFAKLKRQAIKCSLSGVALRANRFDMQDMVEKLMDDRKLVCKFMEQKGDTFYVDIVVDGVSVKDELIRAKYLSILSKDIEIERLVGQTVMAQIVSFKDLSSFQINVCGCDTIFEASYRTTNHQPGAKPNDKKLPTGETIPIRIDSLLLGKTFAITPVSDIIGENLPPPMACRFPFFSNNFRVCVTHWESYNVAYVQSLTAQSFAESMLNQLFEFYDIGGDLLQEFLSQTLCAVKSADENWYRAEIISETQTDVNVRYLDYGNCEVIPKSLVKRLESQFCNTAALAVKVFLPLNKVYSDRESSVDEIIKLTSENLVDLKVLAYHDQNWIVDLLIDDASIISIIKTKNSCKTMTVDEVKKQISDKKIVEKVARLQIQKQQSNHQMELKPSITIVNVELKKQATASENTTPTTEQTTHQNTPLEIKAPVKTEFKTKAFISHIDRPDRFYLQISSITADLDKLQENIQIAAPSLPALEDFSNDTRCIVRYSVDDQWYRAMIIDSDSKITSILFIDYGNTDTITDNSLIKSMNEAFDQIPAFAIPCALPLEAKDRIEWSEESCEMLKNLVDTELEFEFVCKGKSNNFVKLYDGDRDIMAELIQNGHAIKLDSIVSGTNCYISHVNSISDFYIQMESDTDALELVYNILLDESKLDTMTDIKEGVVCAAKYLDDGLWYRSKILSHKAGTTEVFFIDYGNTSVTNDLRIIPTEIANAPPLAKYCSLVKPKDIQDWTESAEHRFAELTNPGIFFLVDVISPGKQSIVDLRINEKSVLEELSNLCVNKNPFSSTEKTLQSNANGTSETFKALIVEGSPSQFYIQLDSDSSELDRLWGLLETASTWPTMDEIVVGGMCAALFEGSYYRAKILSLRDDGALVHYVDYGNNSFSPDLRKLPENLQTTKHLAISCSLESNNGTFSPQTIARFASLSREQAYDMKYVSKESSPVIVQLFENGVLLFEEKDKISSHIANEAADRSQT